MCDETDIEKISKIYEDKYVYKVYGGRSGVNPEGGQKAKSTFVSPVARLFVGKRILWQHVEGGKPLPYVHDLMHSYEPIRIHFLIASSIHNS